MRALRSTKQVVSLVGMTLLTAVLFLNQSCTVRTANDSTKEPTKAEPGRPNILLIVADDLGYSDIGVFGGEIATPNLDRLAAEGLAFSNFYVLPTCSPTRASLLTGNDNHVAGMGVMSEFIYPAISHLPGYSGHLNDQVAVLPEVLRGAGYHTYMTGKWHLGDEDQHSPFRRGFDKTFAMMHGGASHWADMRPLSPANEVYYRRNGERIYELPSDFYSTKDYTDTLIEFIESDLGSNKPFFAYLSFTAPHNPLHAPADYIKKYEGRYDEGWHALTASRLQSLKKIGLIPQHVTELPANPLVKQWDSLSEEQQRKSARDMEVYAAMVDYMDMSINRLFDFLRANDLYDNTLIVFMSDNGANGTPAAAYPGNADGKYLASFDNAMDNRGLEGSYVSMGAGWAQASSTPFRLYKSFTTEGGIKSPLIVRHPGNRAERMQWNHSFVHVTDITPTLLQAAGVAYPTRVNGKPIKLPVGRSILPVLIGEQASIAREGGVGYELFEMKALFQGDFKLLRMPQPFGTGGWQLYNLQHDPGEIHDVADRHPAVKQSMIEDWQRYASDNQVYDHKGRFDALYRKAYGGEGKNSSSSEVLSH